MHPIWAVIVAASRARRDQGRAGQPSLLRLVGEELAWAVGQAVHPAKMAAAAGVAIGIGWLLGPSTPGPVLGAGWRLAVSVVLGFVGLAVAHALLQRRPGRGAEPFLAALRVTLAGAAVLVVGSFVLAYLLAAVAGTPAGPEAAGGLSATLSIDGPLLGGAALLLAGVVSAAFSHRLQVPGALLFLGLGMLVGDDGLGWIALDDPDLVQSLGVVALVVVLFDGGLSTTPRQLRVGLVPGLALATVGVGITAGVTAVGAMALLDVEPRVAWLLGAIVASTDATAVFALLRRAPVPERIAAMLQVESGANDPVAILLTVGLLAAWDAPPNAATWLGFGATQLVGGVVVGVVVGGFGAALLRRLVLGTAGLYPILGLAFAGIAYGAAAAVGASGFLATFVAGISIGVEAPRRRLALRSFLDTLSSGVEVGLFLLLGLLVFPSDLPDVAAVSLGVAVLLVLVARPVAAAVSLAWFDLPWREVAAVAWLGMRGAVPIVLATLVFSAGVAEADLIFDVVFFVVLLSVVVQGLSAPMVVRRLGLDRTPTPGAIVAEALPLDRVGLDVVEVELPLDSPLVGRRLDAVPPPDDVLVVAVVRGAEVLVPRGPTALRAGDRLVTSTRDQVAGARRVEAWVAGEPAPSATPPG